MLNLPPEMLKQVLFAGVFLGIMSIIDTLAYGVRTAGAYTKRLAIALALFNILVIFSRLSNMFQAPIIGNFADKVEDGIYTLPNVITALRVDLVFVIGGVLIGAVLTPTAIRLFSRGIDLVNERGSLPPVLLYGLRRFWHIKKYISPPRISSLRKYMDFRTLPMNFLVFNIFVTCFYSIGVMSTVVAASMDHGYAATTTNLSGIVNGIATMLLFIIVDPPAAVVLDQCISDKRTVTDVKTMNVYLIATRLAGCILGILLLPAMGKYVLTAARWVDAFFGSGITT